MLAGDVEQLGGALALLPQGRAPPGIPARQQQSAGRALAEAGGEQGRGAHALGHDLLELLRVEEEQLGARRLVVGRGQPQDDAVVGGLR